MSIAKCSSYPKAKAKRIATYRSACVHYSGSRVTSKGRDRLAIDPKERTLFLTNDGKPINPDSLTEYGRRYIKAASVEKPGACHIFRHTMATLMHDAGADIRNIQEILGHERLDTTQIYSRVSLKKLLETHQKTHPAEQPDQPASQSTAKPSSSPAKDKTDPNLLVASRHIATGRCRNPCR